MKMTWIGSGSAFTLNNFHSMAVLESDNGKCLLLDCGSDVRFAMANAEIKPSQIDAVYISHLHGDHSGGMEWLGFYTHFVPNHSKPTLFIHPRLQNPLWLSLEHAMYAEHEKTNTLSDYFETGNFYDPDGSGELCFSWEGCSFQLIENLHVKNSLQDMKTYGLFIMSESGQAAYFTADTKEMYGDNPSNNDAYELANIIFHDCETINTSEVHAHYNRMKSMPDNIKKKMWLYHTNDSAQPKVEDDGFAGIVQRGQVFNF